MKKYYARKSFWNDNFEYREGQTYEMTDEQAEALGESRVELFTGKNKPTKSYLAEDAPQYVKIRTKNRIKKASQRNKEASEDDEEFDEDEELEEDDEDLSQKQVTDHPNKMIDKNTPRAKRK